MERDNRRLSLMAIITILILVTALFYGYMDFKDGIDLGGIVALAIPLIITILMLFFIARRYQDIKQGMPLEDERSKRVMTNAAAQSFYISLYWLLLLSWIEPEIVERFNVVKPDTSTIVSAGIGGMALIFFISWFYYNKKGKLS